MILQSLDDMCDGKLNFRIFSMANRPCILGNLQTLSFRTRKRVVLGIIYKHFRNTVPFYFDFWVKVIPDHIFFETVQ